MFLLLKVKCREGEEATEVPEGCQSAQATNNKVP